MIAASLGLLLALRAMTVDDLWKIERVGAPSHSPDGSLVAFTVTVPDPVKNTSNGDLFLVPFDGSAAPRRMTVNDGADGSPVFSPDGREIIFSANATDPPFVTLNYDLFTVNPAGGVPVNVTPTNLADDCRPRYTPDGRSVVYGRQLRPRIDSDFTRLARLDRRTGKSVELAPSFDRQPSDWTIAPGGGLVYFHAEDHGKVHLYATPVAGGRPRAVVKGGTIGNVAVTRNGALAFTRQSLLSPAELWRARPDGTGQEALTAFGVAAMKPLDLGRVEDTVFKGAAGDDVQMFVVTPPGFDPASDKTWPLIHLIHGGPHSSWIDSFGYRWNPLLFADFMEATDALIARGLVDRDRMAAAGGSYGGYLTAWILGHTDRFKALVVHAGVYDLMAQFGSDSAFGRSNNYGAEPWVDPARVDLYSPSRFASDFKTPRLILHGEKDYRVPYAQALNLYGVLTAKGVPTRIVVFPEENHWVLKAQSAQLWCGEVLDWLDRWLARAS